MVHRAIMRNFLPFLKTPQLSNMMRPLFIDDNENQNQVKFAMMIQLKDLPVYQKEQNITGFNADFDSIMFPEEPDFQVLRESNELFGAISESLMRERYFDRQSIKESKDYVDNKHPDENNKKVDHYSINFNPDPLFYKAQRYQNNFGEDEDLTEHFNLPEVLHEINSKFFIDIEQQYVVRKLIDKEHELVYWFFLKMFAAYMFTFAIP